ncbi:MAG: glycosyltransferase, partial [Flavobacteriales bacterium]
LNFHIGIMPLPNEEWTKGKCGFKLIQYMSLGIVPVASNVGVNSTIISHHERGVLCNDLSDWKNTLNELIEDHHKRVKFGKESKKFIQNNYSVESQVNKFLLLFAD